MAGPTSARWAAGFVFAFTDAVILLMVSIICGGAAKGNKKPTALSPWVLLNDYVQQAPTASPATTTTRMTA
jgi:hypothetical protein